MQSDLDYIFRIGFEIIKKYPVKIYGSMDLFNSIFFQGHLRLFLPLPLVCYNKMVKKKNSYAWGMTVTTQVETWICDRTLQKILSNSLLSLFFFFKRILLRSNSVSGFQKFIYCLPRTQSENIKHDTKWRLYGIRKSCSEYYSWQIYFKVTKSNQAWPFLYNFYTILSYILLLFFFFLV